ncbi:TonB-dependent siderophore receptor [uncultured Maricaulis sp.]|uniref:TonB-dependent receptor plug domain-containing protein n=1 Tax=uncultured Maricaulis sp. TaxID=174710 RepID=UPI00261C9157|nr:TonB-dependent receptor [uncultured Maricaulis sp.]
MKRTRRVVAAGVCLAALACGAVQASEAETGVAVYTPDAFAEFLPRTALDLVWQLPGFGLNGGDNVRGLSGAQGNVLINGRRPPRGSGSLEGRIRAIRVEDVVRLELIEPGARDVDMQGYPLLLNIVTRSTSAARVDGRIEIEPREDGGEEYQGELTTAWSTGPLELEARIDLYDETLTDYAEIRSSTADEPFARATVDELEGRTRRDWQALARLAIDPRNDLELTLSSERNNDFSRPIPASAAEVGAIEAGRYDAIERFGSARWRHALTDRIDLTGLVTQRQGEAVSSDSLVSGGSVSESASSRETGETAARADMRWRPTDALAVETGLTWASNTLEGSSSASIDGVSQTVDGDDAAVEETRSAILASATWTPNSRVSATFGGRVEQFSLDSSNEGGASLSLTDIAPRADLNWALPDDWTLRLSTERRVGQLDLGLFLASTDLDNALSTAGASTLEPPRDWINRVTLERRFGERDLVRFEGVTRRSDNPVSSILDADGEVRPANIGPENVARATAEFEIELDRFGFDGLSLDGMATHRWSDRLDPLQGFARTTSGHRDYHYRIGLRQEWADGRYVVSARLEERAPAMHYWLTEIRKEDNGLNAELNGEWRHSAAWRTGLSTRWQQDRTDTIYVFDGVREPGSGPVLVNTLTRSEGVYANLWSEWEVRQAAFFRVSLRSGRDRSGTSRVDTPQGVFLDQLSRSADNVPTLNIRLRFQR